MRLVLVIAGTVLFGSFCNAFQSSPSQPQLLLTDQRLKRLKRDRDRQTQRWLNLEARIKNSPDSPERGFELALYYRITAEPGIVAQANAWLQSHPCERRQAALLKSVLSMPEIAPLPAASCPPDSGGPVSRMRDSVFETLFDEQFHFDRDKFLALLRATPLDNAAEIYAAAELLLALGRSDSNSIREQDSQFFNSVPVQFLLSLKPGQVEHPDWKVHVAALALVALDPNSDSSQFLQGWAIEDRQMLQDGPGVAYELLWADPYLPGVGYQNLDPWWYDQEHSRLLARTGWTSDACAIRIAPDAVSSVQCPSSWKSQRMAFGHMTLIPMTEPCIAIAARPNNAFIMLGAMPPNAHLKVSEGGKTLPQQADRSGLWRVPSNVSGKVCAVK